MLVTSASSTSPDTQPAGVANGAQPPLVRRDSVGASAASAVATMHVVHAPAPTRSFAELVRAVEVALDNLAVVEMAPQEALRAYEQFAKEFPDPTDIQLRRAIGVFTCRWDKIGDIRVNLGNLLLLPLPIEARVRHIGLYDTLALAEDAVKTCTQCLEQVLPGLEWLRTCEVLKPGELDSVIRPMADAFDAFEFCRSDCSGLVSFCGKWPRELPLDDSVHAARSEFIDHAERLLKSLGTGEKTLHIDEKIRQIKGHAVALNLSAPGVGPSVAALPAALPRHSISNGPSSLERKT